jgi:aminobenzoyl-glutamate utilization protein B
MKKYVLSILLFAGLIASAQKKPTTNPTEKLKLQALQDIQQHYDEYKKTALQIWDYAELGYKEQKSSALLQQILKRTVSVYKQAWQKFLRPLWQLTEAGNL